MVQNFICLVVPSQCFSKCGKRPAALESCVWGVGVVLIKDSSPYIRIFGEELGNIYFKEYLVMVTFRKHLFTV